MAMRSVLMLFQFKNFDRESRFLHFGNGPYFTPHTPYFKFPHFLVSPFFPSVVFQIFKNPSKDLKRIVWKLCVPKFRSIGWVLTELWPSLWKGIEISWNVPSSAVSTCPDLKLHTRAGGKTAGFPVIKTSRFCINCVKLHLIFQFFLSVINVLLKIWLPVFSSSFF